MNQSKLNQNGSVLLAAVIFGVIGFSLLTSFFSWSINRRYALDYRIAKKKALYNAETGLAEKAYSIMIRADFTGTDTTLVPGGVRIDSKSQLLSQGLYKNVNIQQGLDSLTYQVMINGKAQGVAWVKNQFGRYVEVIDSAYISFVQQSLAKYMYLTQREQAGGAPYVFDSPGNRRHVTFGSNDVLSGGISQTNEYMTMSDFGCPEFLGTVYITIDPISGEPLSPQMGSCQENQVFLGEPPTVERPPVKLPPDGYALAKNAADFIFDATELFKQDFSHRDTLIMTDIRFLPDGRFNVKRWWYLAPPHLNQNAAMAGSEFPFVLFNPSMLEGVTDPSAQCTNPSNLRTCDPYVESMANYQAKSVINGIESYMDPTVNGPHGFANFDIVTHPPDADHLIQDQEYSVNGPKVIYVKGGPVRVHGIYKGRYTVVTDEYETYHRHAWNTTGAPIDTVWCNIWITDDLRNADAPLGNQLPPQPDDACEGGSENRMGLVSGANVIVANTLANGANNNPNGNVIIHAAIVAFNESFTVQYWQNTTTQYWDNPPPKGDGLSAGYFGPANDTNDSRGNITVAGGIVQKYRGYVVRNNPGPYMVTIGYGKDYSYDENNACSPPPYFPTIQFENNEKEVELVGYGPI